MPDEFGTSNLQDLAEWCQQSDPNKSMGIHYKNGWRFGRAFAVVMFWFFICLVAVVSAPDVIVWLITNLPPN